MATAEQNSAAVSGFRFSDIIEVIENDPDYAGPSRGNLNSPQTSSSVIATSRSSQIPVDPGVKKKPYLQILEQPASKAIRFRYECEGRSAGSIPGANSTNENKTFPTVQIIGYRGRAVVIVSCVTKDAPYKPHPHSLVGKDGCKKGVCTVEVNNELMIHTFSNLGIQCVKKKGIEEALKLREEMKIDPFKTGFGHGHQTQNIDLNAVRLCFQAFVEDGQKGKRVPLKPVVSDPIYDKKSMNDLTICKLSHAASPVSGRKEMIILCDKVTKDDVQVRFYEERDGHVVWEGFGEFQSCDVHKQVAISFRTPPYRTLDITGPVQVYIQLRRPSDKITSESRPFQYLPVDSDVDALKRKRLRLAANNNHRLEAFIRNATAGEQQFLSVAVPPMPAIPNVQPAGSRPVRQGTRTKIKKEPLDVASPGIPDYSAVLSPMADPYLQNLLQMDLLQDLPVGLSSCPPNFPPVNATFPTVPDTFVASPSSSNNLSLVPGSYSMDLDLLNIDEQTGHLEAHVDILDSQLLKNLSLTDIAETPTKVINTQTDLALELPDLSLSGLLTSAELNHP